MAKVNKVIDNSYGYYMYANGTSHWGIGVYKGDECPILISKELHNAPETIKAPIRAKDIKLRLIMDNSSKIHLVSQFLISPSQLSFK